MDVPDLVAADLAGRAMAGAAAAGSFLRGMAGREPRRGGMPD